MDVHFPTEAEIAALPLWQGQPALEPLPGGLSNLSYVATDDSGRYVVRVTRDFPFHQVYRDREVRVAQAAHAAGFSPEVVHATQGLMISRFVEGVPLTVDTVRADIPRLASFLGRFHRDMATDPPLTDFAFRVFDVNRDYLRLLGESGAASSDDLTQWWTINEKLEAAQSNLPMVFGHHDLLPGNWLDDGTRLWLIDFEYAGLGAPSFDLANLSSNANFTLEQSRILLEAYFDREPGDELIRSHRAMEAASLLREALWSLVSAVHIHERDVDYSAYAALNLARLTEAMDAI